MKKVFLLFTIFLMCAAFVSAAGVTCNIFGYNYTSATNSTTTIYNVINSTNKYINGSDDRTVNSILEITPRINFTITECDWYLNMTNNTGMILVYRGVDVLLNITNKENSSELMSSGNYSSNLTSGRVTSYWDSAGNYTFAGKNISVCYNKTFYKYSADLTDYTNLSNVANEMYQTSGTFGDYNNQIGVGLTTYYATYGLNNTDWVVTWTYIDRACADSAGISACQNTQRTIYAAFGLIALFAIVLAAFIIIGMFQGGNLDGSAIMATILGIVGLCVVIFVAFIIVNKVGLTTCGV